MLYGHRELAIPIALQPQEPHEWFRNMSNTCTKNGIHSKYSKCRIWVFRFAAHTYSRLVMIAVLFLCSLEVVWGSGVTAEGYFTVTSFGGTGNPIPRWSSTNQFRVSMSPDGRCSFEVRPAHEQGDVIHLAFDGTDTFFARYREAVVDVNQNIITRKPLEQNVHPGYISSGNYPFVPYEEQKRVHILWLVYGTGKYLHDSATNTMILPWVAGRWSLLAYGFRIEYTLSLDPPYPPQELQFIRDLSFDRPTEESEMERLELDSSSGDSRIADWRKQLQDKKLYWTNGFVAGKLESGNFTNRNGIVIPLSFSFKAFHPRWSRKLHGLRWQYDGVITNLADLPPSEAFRPPIIAPLRIQDSRFRFRDATRAIDGINYVTTNAWPQRDSAEMKRRFQAALGGRDISPRLGYRSARMKRLGVTLGFMLVALSLPVFLLWRAKKGQK